MVRFDVSALTGAPVGTTLALDVDAGPQSLTDLAVDFFRGTTQVTRVQGGLLVQGTVESQLELECVRCLEPFMLPLVLELEEVFQLAGTRPRPEMPYSTSDNGWLDLTPLLREQSWLSIPMKPLCDPDCKGLWPQCGVNLDSESCTCKNTKIDPRLSVLEDLL